MKARITVTLKPSVLDPQGKAIEGALHALEVPGIKGVRQGKVFDIDMDDMAADAATTTLKAAAEKLLANLIVETYRIELV
ncbi:MAG: phosphoribosylformylglycinamidine synthase subunit PurS [Hyphomicrobiales bacterium]|nr:phosphoribosylformylglycinamidine synthase subunit PurS [Hyphomicrobiales bacterium]